jgi:hypothetical protein
MDEDMGIVANEPKVNYAQARQQYEKQQQQAQQQAAETDKVQQLY